MLLPKFFEKIMLKLTLNIKESYKFNEKDEPLHLKNAKLKVLILK